MKFLNEKRTSLLQLYLPTRRYYSHVQYPFSPHDRRRFNHREKNTISLKYLFVIYIFEYKTLHTPKRSNILTSPPFAPPRTVIFCRFLRAWGKQKIPISLGNQDFTVFCFSSKWCHQESNRGHKDFQSFALPTELWHQSFSFAVAKVSKVFETANYSRKKYEKKLK